MCRCEGENRMSKVLVCACACKNINKLLQSTHQITARHSHFLRSNSPIAQFLTSNHLARDSRRSGQETVEDLAADEPRSVDSAVSMMCEEQLDYERDRGAIVVATATIDRRTLAKCAFEVGTAISSWLMSESRLHVMVDVCVVGRRSSSRFLLGSRVRG